MLTRSPSSIHSPATKKPDSIGTSGPKFATVMQANVTCDNRSRATCPLRNRFLPDRLMERARLSARTEVSTHLDFSATSLHFEAAEGSRYLQLRGATQPLHAGIWNLRDPVWRKRC